MAGQVCTLIFLLLLFQALHVEEFKKLPSKVLNKCLYGKAPPRGPNHYPWHVVLPEHRNTGTSKKPGTPPKTRNTPRKPGTPPKKTRNTPQKTRNTPRKPGTPPRKPETPPENQEHSPEKPEHPQKTRNIFQNTKKSAKSLKPDRASMLQNRFLLRGTRTKL